MENLPENIWELSAQVLKIMANCRPFDRFEQCRHAGVVSLLRVLDGSFG
jgi:hypothetical protein